MNEKEIKLADGTILKPIEYSDEQMKKLSEMMNSPEYQNFATNQIQEQLYKNLGFDKKPEQPKNLMVVQQEKLNTLVEQLELKLTSIQYENMKLNAQIETLNKTIDSDNEKLDELKTTNINLKAVNKTLLDNNKHYIYIRYVITTVPSIILFAFYCVFLSNLRYTRTLLLSY